MSGEPAVEVWRIRLAPILARNDACRARLNTGERARAAGFADPRAARRFVATRLVLRTLLAHRLDIEPDAIRIVTSADGRPVLAAAGPTFSVAHSGDMALCAMAAGQVRLGVDLERLRPVPRALALAREVLGEAVVDELARLPPPARARAFLTAWTRHEALVKAAGGGLAQALAQAARFRSRTQGLACHPVPLPAGHVGAVACATPVPPRVLDFPPDWLDWRRGAERVAPARPLRADAPRPALGL